MKCLKVIVFLGIGLTLHAQNFLPKEEARPSGIPAFDLLPNGSILRRVQLPRYDEGNKLEYLIKVNQLTVVDDTQLDGRDVGIYLYDQEGDISAESKLQFANLNKTTGIIRTVDDFQFRRPDFFVQSAGFLYSVEDKQGLLFGPVLTEFNELQSYVTTPINTLPALALAATLPLIPTALLAEPQPASQEELNNLKEKAEASEDPKFEESTSSIIKRSEEEAEKADLAIQNFLKKTGHEQTVATSSPEASETDSQNSEKEENTTPAPKAGTSIKATCSGGMFFDTEKGLFVYRENVQLTNSDFTLKCKNELKIFLDKKDVKSNNKEIVSTPEFGDIKEAIATGNVKIRIKDNTKKGPNIIANAANAIFNGKTQTFILQGGFPSIQQGNNRVRALKEGLSIRITEAGVATDSFGNGDNWETEIVVPEN